MSERIRYEERDGRRYAYKSTSKRVPGRKNPVSMKEYLGVVDQNTGEIRKKHPRPGSSAHELDGAEALNYGDALIAYEIARKIGMIDDLRDVFGNRAPAILALALAEAIHPTSFDTVDTIIGSSYLPKLAGLERKASVKSTRDTVNSIQYDEVRRYFKLRYGGHSERLYAFAYPMTVYNGIRNSAMGASDVSTVTEVIIAVTNAMGDPIEFNSIGGIENIPNAVRRLMEDINRTAECIFISDPSISPYLSVPALIAEETEFGITYDSRSEQYHAVISDYADVTSPDYRREYGTYAFHIKEGRIGYIQTDKKWDLVPQSDPRYKKADFSLSAFVCYDPHIHSQAMRDLRRSLSDIRRHLNGCIFDGSGQQLIEMTGQYARFFLYSTDNDGRTRLKVRRGEISKYGSHAGKTLISMSSVTLNDIMTVRIARSRLSYVVNRFYHRTQDLRKYSGKGICTETQMFIEFLAMTVYSEVKRLLDAAGVLDLDVEDVFTIASTYRVIVTSEGVFRSSHSPRVARVLKIMDIDEQSLDFPRRHVSLTNLLLQLVFLQSVHLIVCSNHSS